MDTNDEADFECAEDVDETSDAEIDLADAELELYEDSADASVETIDANAELYEGAVVNIEQSCMSDTLRIDIGENSESFHFDMADIEVAYDKAVEADDKEAMVRLSNIYELAVFKDELNLNLVGSDIPQIAGNYGEIKAIDPEGFEAHHIPGKSSVEGDINKMPAISMMKEDHALTDSYRGRSNHVYEPFIPGNVQFDSYKYEIGKEINNGNFVHVIRSEVYNIRDQCGSKYDGAIGKYLDTVAKNVAEQGIPTGKEREN